MTTAPARPGFTTTIEELRIREWLIGSGQPSLVLDLFTHRDWTVVVDGRADVHINSKDGRVYVGWFPSGRPGADSDAWVIAVTGTSAQAGWSTSFTSGTPTELIAAFIDKLIATPSRPAA